MNQKYLIVIGMGFFLSSMWAADERAVRRLERSQSKKQRVVTTQPSLIELTIPSKSYMGGTIDMKSSIGRLDINEKEMISQFTYRELLNKRIASGLPLIIAVVALFNQNLEQVTYRSYEAYNYLRFCLGELFYEELDERKIAFKFKDVYTGSLSTVLSPYFFAIWPNKETQYLGNYKFFATSTNLPYLLNAFLPEEFIANNDYHVPLQATICYLDKLINNKGPMPGSISEKITTPQFIVQLVKAASFREKVNNNSIINLQSNIFSLAALATSKLSKSSQAYKEDIEKQHLYIDSLLKTN